MYDCTEDGENKGQIKWITAVYLCAHWENFLPHTIVLYFPLTKKIMGISFHFLILFLCTQMLTSLMCFQCGWKQPWKGKQNKVKMRWSWHYDRSHRILQTFPVLKAYQCPQSLIHYSINCSECSPMSVRIIAHPSISARIFSVGVTVMARSLHILTSLLWLHNVGNFNFILKVNAKKLLYQKGGANSFIFLFNALNQIVTMKIWAQSLFFLWSWVYS